MLTTLQELHILTIRNLTEKTYNEIPQGLLNKFQDIFFNAHSNRQKNILLSCLSTIQNVSKLFSLEIFNITIASNLLKFISSDNVISILVKSFLTEDNIIQYTSKCTLVAILNNLSNVNQTDTFCLVLFKVNKFLKENNTNQFKILELVAAILKQLTGKTIENVIMSFCVWKCFHNLRTDVDNLCLCLEFLGVILSIDTLNKYRQQIFTNIDFIFINFDTILSQHQYRLKNLLVLKKIFSVSHNHDPHTTLYEAGIAKKFVVHVENSCNGHFLKELVCSHYKASDNASFAVSTKKLNKAEIMALVSTTLHATELCALNNMSNISQISKIVRILLDIDQEKSSIEDKILDLFLEQDDELIEILLLHLSISLKSTEEFLFHPHSGFLKLLQHLSFDTSILLDWLTANETEFLLYFVKYLKYFASTFAQSNVFSNEDCTRILSMLKELRMKIEKLDKRGIFPYSPKPLLRNMIAAEKLLQQ